MENYIHLFTPVSEGGLEKGIVTILMTTDNKITIGYLLEDTFYGIHGFELINITHYLDISKLTTKEKAKQLIQDTADEVCEYGDAWEIIAQENIKKL